MITKLLFKVLLILISSGGFAFSAIELFNYPSLDSYNYDEEYKDISKRMNQPDCVAVIAFNRPQYLAQTIASLEQNPESQTIPFYFFLDGGPKSKQEENKDIITRSAIKHKYIIARPKNYGCPKNHVDSKRFLFDWCGFERVIILEEDIKVAPSYIHTMHALDEWAKKTFANIGAVQTWACDTKKRFNKRNHLNDVIETGYDFWWCFIDYCISKKVWDDIKRVLYQFETFVNLIPDTSEYDLQRSKPAKHPEVSFKIKFWLKHYLKSIRKQKNLFDATKSIKAKRLIRIIERAHSAHFEPCQDAMTGIALYTNGYVKLRTAVNRAVHIGEEGISFTKEKFDSTHVNSSLEIFNEDFEIKDFNYIDEAVLTDESS